MPTRRENLLAVLRGEKSAWTPCSINFAQWYGHQTNHNLLPDELKDTKTHIEVMKLLGMDLFSRNIDCGIRSEYEGLTVRNESEPGKDGQRHTSTIETPHGELTQVREDQQSMTTSYTVEDYVKDWDKDSDAFMYALERLKFSWEREHFAKWHKVYGDDGVVLVPVASSPLKFIHVNFGLDGSCFFFMDHPKAAKKVADMYWQRVLPLFEQIANDPDVNAVTIMDNVDTPFYPPYMCEEYWTPYIRQVVDIVEPLGKRVFVHACGQLHGLIDQFRASGVHGLEGMSHPPLGDITIPDVKNIHDKFIYNGGFGAHEQVTMSDDQVKQHYEKFFGELDGWERFIFGSSCQTAITTSWDRIKMVVDLCRQYGGSSEWEKNGVSDAPQTRAGVHRPAG